MKREIELLMIRDGIFEVKQQQAVESIRAERART